MNITEKIPTVMLEPKDQETVLLVAKMLFKAKYPLRRWAHTKPHAQGYWLERAEKAFRLVVKDERNSVEKARIF